MLTPFRKLVFLAGLCCAGGLIAANAPTAGKQYDYVSIVQRADELQISNSQAAYQEIKTTEDRVKARESNYTALFRKMNEFEAQGYELVENTVYTLGEGAIPRNYILMRRPR
jgi:hypothetical protein